MACPGHDIFRSFTGGIESNLKLRRIALQKIISILTRLIEVDRHDGQAFVAIFSAWHSSREMIRHGPHQDAQNPPEPPFPW